MLRPYSTVAESLSCHFRSHAGSVIECYEYDDRSENMLSLSKRVKSEVRAWDLSYRPTKMIFGYSMKPNIHIFCFIHK